MKILHLADLHLGKVVNEFSMIEDQKYVLEQVNNLIDSEKIDAVLIAGDVYDRKLPPEEAVALFDWFLTGLAERGIPVLVISGNHDSGERLQFGSSLFEKNSVYISGRYRGEIPQVVLEDENGEVVFYLLPFINAVDVRNAFPDDEIRNYEDAVRVAIEHTTIDRSKRNVILAHQFVAGSSAPQLSGSETAIQNAGTSDEPVANVGTMDMVGAKVFEQFDYVALGHIHRPQSVGKKTIRYAGSPLKYSQREVNQKKSFTIVTLAEKGNVSVEEIPVKPLHEMISLRGTLSDLTDPANVTYPDAYIFAELTDQDMIPNAMDMLRTRYPNAMGLKFVRKYDGEELADSRPGDSKEKSFTELVNGFYMLTLGREPDDEEMQIITDAAKEAGVAL